MPTSTQKGFSMSKWESNYLRCRYRAHRNKVAAAKPAIDSGPPRERPHVRYKNKKALAEKRRQAQIYNENLRILTSTADIMMGSEATMSRRMKSSDTTTLPRITDTTSRPMTGLMKRNTHVVLQWFLHKFGSYVPWWAQVSY